MMSGSPKRQPHSQTTGGSGLKIGTALPTLYALIVCPCLAHIASQSAMESFGGTVHPATETSISVPRIGAVVDVRNRWLFHILLRTFDNAASNYTILTPFHTAKSVSLASPLPLRYRQTHVWPLHPHQPACRPGR